MRRTGAKDPQLHVSLAAPPQIVGSGFTARWPSSETARFGVFDGEKLRIRFLSWFSVLGMMIPVWSLGLATNGLLALLDRFGLPVTCSGK